VIVMLVCGAVLLAGLVLGARWSRLPFESPPPIDAPSAGEVARRVAWYCSWLLLAGITSGITVVGTGGRLAMRLLAVTAGDDAQGRITEASEVVGEITVDGTIGFILFGGIFAGVASSTIYLLIRRLLPAGWVGGLVFGAGLLVLFGSRLDPIRQDNPDFDVVGPGWLAVLVFTALALAYGVALTGFVARLSAWLPLPTTHPSDLVKYLPIGLVAAVGFTVTAPLIVVGALTVAATRWPPVLRAVRSARAVRIGRVALLALIVISLPGPVQSITDIVNRSPS
jgi:hypothetical protein